MKRDMLETVDALPPNYDAIVAVLPHAADPGVMFAYDGKVYGRGLAKQLTRELDAHERVHLVRQQSHAGGPTGWWDQYLADTAFRYVEELVAHRAEYATYCARHINPVKRAQFLRRISTRLASPLYGAGVTVDLAMLGIKFTPCEIPT